MTDELLTHPHLEGLIPDRLLPDDGNGDEDAYNSGWNACIAEVARRLAALPGGGVDGWQPMETAPKSEADGSRVSGIYLLGFVPDGEIDFDPNACIDIVWWEPLLPNKEGTRGKWCRSAGDTTVECEPTHWRPLPKTPALPTPNPHEADRNG